MSEEEVPTTTPRILVDTSDSQFRFVDQDDLDSSGDSDERCITPIKEEQSRESDISDEEHWNKSLRSHYKHNKKMRQINRKQEIRRKQAQLDLTGDDSSARYKSLRVFPQESQDEEPESGLTSPHSEPVTPSHAPTSAASSLDPGESLQSRYDFFKTLKTYQKVNRMAEGEAGAGKRGSRWERWGDFEMRGRRNSQLFTGNSRREKHETAEVIWLHLQAYISERPMKTKADIVESTSAHDVWLLRRREEAKDVIGDLLTFRLDRGEVGHASFSMAGAPLGAPEEPIQSLSPSPANEVEEEEERLGPAHSERLKMALGQVADLLHRWEAFEALFPSSRVMRDQLGPEYTAQLHDRLLVLYCWYNVTRDLCRATKDVGSLLGMDKTGIWPAIDYESEATSSDQEALDSDVSCSPTMPVVPITTSILLNDNSGNVSPMAVDLDGDSIESGVYRKFVERSLRLRDMRKVLVRLDNIMGRTLAKARKILEVGSPSPEGTFPDVPTLKVRDETELAKSSAALRKKFSSSTGAIPVREESLAVETAARIWRDAPKRKASLQVPALLTQAASSANVRILHGSHLTSEDESESVEFGMSHAAWKEMALLSPYPWFLHLLRVPLNLVHEWLRLRVEQKTSRDPDVVTLKTIISDSHDCLNAAVEVKGCYQQFVCSTVAVSDDRRLLRLNVDYLEQFETDLGQMYKIYLENVRAWGVGLTRLEEMRTVGGNQSFLETLGREWKFAKAIAINVRSGEQDAALIFCGLSGQMLRDMVSGFMERRHSDISRRIRDGSWAEEASEEETPAVTVNYHICREFREFWGEVRERALRALDFAKLLRFDMEISAKFRRLCSQDELLRRLLGTGHVLVQTPHGCEDFLMFCQEAVSGNVEQLKLLLNVTCGRDDSEVPSGLACRPGYLLLVKSESSMEKAAWAGRRVKVIPDADTDASLHYMQVDAVYLVVVNSASLKAEVRSLRKSLSEGEFLALEDEQCSCHEIIAEKLNNLKELALGVRSELAERLRDMHTELLEERRTDSLETHEKAAFRHALSRAYDFLFEYHKELGKLISTKFLADFGREMGMLVKDWSGFVQTFCEEGHGSPPSWARQGMDFLILAVSPEYTGHLTQAEFEELKEETLSCVHYIIGGDRIKDGLVGSLFRQSSETTAARHRDNLSLPTQSSSTSQSISAGSTPRGSTSRQQSSGSGRAMDGSGSEVSLRAARAEGRRRRMHALRALDSARHEELMEARKIGRCLSGGVQEPHRVSAVIEAKKLNFNWQRLEKKIGEGKFGVVHTALNLDTGQLMAVKQIDFERQDLRVMRLLVEEIRNFETITHPNLVRYFGVEVHRDQLLIFMEYCDEGTLERVCRENIATLFIRQYLNYLLRGVIHLHANGIVHRDIKPGNIFLTSGSSVLKLGDFGSSARIHATNTNAGELTDYVGTPMYMAPEVITGKGQGSEGHGRPADVWSIGCVVLEMATGKVANPYARRAAIPHVFQWPWHDAAPMQIIWKVGNGGAPNVPDSVSPQCRDLLSKCLVTEPEKRWTASQLISHDFANVSSDAFETQAD